MGDCRLNDPATLSAWLEGSLDLPTVQAIDRHLLEGCPSCWGVLEFVERLRELVGGEPTSSGSTRANRASVLLDTEALLRVIGLPTRGLTHRELLVEVGSWDTSIRVRGALGDPDRRLEVLARSTVGAPPEPMAVTIHRGEQLLAKGDTDAHGRLTLPLRGHGLLRVVLSASGQAPCSVALRV
jgi:hypothetical protein